VYGFHHFDHEVVANYPQIFTQDKKEPLEISPDHMVFVDRHNPVPASWLEVGDVLGDSKVARVKTIQRRGAYAPLTESGSVVVSGILASNSVDTLHISPAFQHKAAHAILALRRLVCFWDFDICLNETRTGGFPDWCLPAFRLLKKLSEQSMLLQIGATLVVAPFAAAAYVLEKLILSPLLLIGMMVSAGVFWWYMEIKVKVKTL
jgi:hypothetical protein